MVVSALPFGYDEAFLEHFDHPPPKDRVLHGFTAYGLRGYVYKWGDLESRIHVEMEANNHRQDDLHQSVVNLINDLAAKTKGRNRDYIVARFFPTAGDYSGFCIKNAEYTWSDKLLPAGIMLVAAFPAYFLPDLLILSDPASVKSSIVAGGAVSAVLFVLHIFVAIRGRKRHNNLKVEVE